MKTLHTHLCFIASWLFLGVSLSCSGRDIDVPRTKIAFIGDQGLGTNAEAVLKLIKSENTDLVVHAGDFDYKDNPAAWEKMITKILGPRLPYLVVVGNHDLSKWSEYQRLMLNRLKLHSSVACEGDLGVNAVCRFHGISFFLSGVGTTGSGHLDYLQNHLSSDGSRWKICVWHKNQKLLQVEDKRDETGWEVYDACRNHGAFIATGHSHVYSRTHLLSAMNPPQVASTSSPMILKPGQNFVFTSGLAGASIRAQTQPNDPWWARIYTSTQKAKYGALFCTFNPKSVSPSKAECYFKNIDNEIVDAFSLESQLKP